MQLDTARQWSALATISFLPCKKECWRGSVVVVPHPLHAGLPSFRRRVISSTRDALLQAVQVSTLLPAARGSVRCSQPPAHRDALAQPSGSRRATPSRRLTRHVSTSTGAPNTSHTRTQSLSNNPRTCATVSFIDIRNMRGRDPPPTWGSNPKPLYRLSW